MKSQTILMRAIRLSVWFAVIGGCGVMAADGPLTDAANPAALPAAASPAGQSSAATQPAVLAPPAWPRTFEKGGDTVAMYQPQVDSWKDDRSMIRFRAAVAVTPKGAKGPAYGVAAVQANTIVDHQARMVLMTNLDVAARFPNVPEARMAELKAAVKEALPDREYLDVSLDQVLACVQDTRKPPSVNVNLNPPPIFYSDVPAILVIYIGPPQFKPVKDTGLMFAVNTNWLVLMDKASSQYYLLDGESWLTAGDPVKGPWTAAKTLPADFSKLPADKEWDEVRSRIPGQPLKNVPRVLASTEPAELIVTDGPPDYTPIPGTRLMYVSNPEMPLFLDLIDNNYYYLASGRWFRAPKLTGPWSSASGSLPAEFAKIPPDSPVGGVLASVPGTQEAQDAVLLASAPHKATVDIAKAKVDVTYDGPPKFAPIEGTSMSYAVNTPYEVVMADGQYYCCYQGVWFKSSAAAGPWAVCTSVPGVIYTIPPSSPLYNVTYVQVYGSTPGYVTLGYTGGYSGEYVAATGTLMFGAGLATGALVASGAWALCNPCFYSYGCGAYYNYADGGYFRGGAACYGPHGGAGWGAAYDPATGTWGRAGYAYGPAGAHWAGQAYNPFTNTYGAHAGGTNGYQSWGRSAVSQDGAWAQSAHVSGARGSAGWAETSSGQGAAGVHTAGGVTAAKTTSGDVYAGHDGNVYKNTDGQWQKYQGDGNWSDSSWAKPNTQWQHPSSDADSENRWQDSLQNRPQNAMQDSWKNDWNNNQWKGGMERGAAAGPGASDWQDRWGQHDTQSGLNQDSWARSHGGDNAASSWQSHGGFGGGDRFGGGFQGHGFGGRGFGGGGFGGFHGGGRR